jgi:hypothetical protein
MTIAKLHNYRPMSALIASAAAVLISSDIVIVWGQLSLHHREASGQPTTGMEGLGILALLPCMAVCVVILALALLATVLPPPAPRSIRTFRRIVAAAGLSATYVAFLVVTHL